MSKYTDKELLILAAKAAGLTDYQYVESSLFTYPRMERRNMGGPEDGFFELQADVWSPLTDDGDALRLAVKLDMQLTIDIHGGESWVNHNSLPEIMVEEYHGGDIYAATRRAIVRAAAAIGSKL